MFRVPVISPVRSLNGVEWFKKWFDANDFNNEFPYHILSEYGIEKIVIVKNKIFIKRRPK